MRYPGGNEGTDNVECQDLEWRPALGCCLPKLGWYSQTLQFFICSWVIDNKAPERSTGEKLFVIFLNSSLGRHPSVACIPALLFEIQGCQHTDGIVKCSGFGRTIAQSWEQTRN